ncbi:hypothetical protein [Blastococcus sp. SYSU D00695]
MTWLWALATGWLVLSLATALVIGRGVRTADQRRGAERGVGAGSAVRPPPVVRLPRSGRSHAS